MSEPICRRLVDLIEHNADRLAKGWLADVRARPQTPTYHFYDEDELYRRVHKVYSNLGKSIQRDTTTQDIAAEYTTLGKRRFEEGFALSEVLEALMLTRRHLWFLVLSEGLLDTAIDLHAALDLNARVILFFDRAMYYTAAGYEERQAAA